MSFFPSSQVHHISLLIKLHFWNHEKNKREIKKRQSAKNCINTTEIEKLEKEDKEKKETTKIYESNISHTESKNEDGLRNRIFGNMASGKGHVTLAI